MDASTIPAGRELDALVAEKVMGLERHEGDCWAVSSAHPCIKKLPAYSTDIAAAWEVWKKMKVSEVLFEAFASFLCVVTDSLESRKGQQPYSLAMFRMDPLAICLAALRTAL